MTMEGDGQPSPFAIYCACERNHSEQTDRRVIDGCREFLGYGDDHQSVMAAYCTNCGCHRNFHRKEEIPMLVDSTTVQNVAMIGSISSHTTKLLLVQVALNQMLLKVGLLISNSGKEVFLGRENVRIRYAYFDNSSVQEPDRRGDIPCIYFAAGNCRKGKFCRFSHYVTTVQNVHELAAARRQLPQQLENVEVEQEDREPKRERTRFTGAQKEAMRGYAERLGWRLLGHHDQRQLFEFCWGIGISLRNFKCWMRNNKRKFYVEAAESSTGSGGLGLFCFELALSFLELGASFSSWQFL